MTCVAAGYSVNTCPRSDVGSIRRKMAPHTGRGFFHSRGHRCYAPVQRRMHKGAIMSVSKRLRYEVLRRDNHRCRYCGTTANESELRVDHVVPVTLGGNDEPSNLVASCHDCNAGKSSASPDASQVEDVGQDALRWAKAMQSAAEAQRQQDWLCERFMDTVEISWDDTFERETSLESGEFSYPDDRDRKYPWCVFVEGKPFRAFDSEREADSYENELRKSTVPPKDEDWQDACRAWFASGLTVKDAQEMIWATARKRHVSSDQRWRYFCGCMWSRLSERQKIAKDLLAAEEE